VVEVIDSHVHLWDTGRFHYPWLETAPGLPRLADPGLVTSLWGARPAGAVLVQAECSPEQGLAEASWLTGQASAWPRAGVVAFAPIENSALIGNHLAALAGLQAVVGVRRTLQDLPVGELLAAALTDGLLAVGAARLAFDACVRADQLPELYEVLNAAPATGVVIDHLGNPATERGLASLEGRAWLSAMAGLATLPQVYVKLSGALLHNVQDPARSAEAIPFLAAALELFGPGRCMVGSDSPVSVPTNPYGDGWAQSLAGELKLDDDALQKVLVHTATKFYGLDRIVQAAVNSK